MDEKQRLQHELAFLWDQCAQVHLKISRAKNALETTHSPLEEECLHDMLATAESERALLDSLIKQHTSIDNPPSLEALIMHQLNEARQAHESLIGVWRRGSPAPKGFWETETRYALLNSLLLRYQNWMRAIPNGQSVVGMAGPRVQLNDDEHDDRRDGHLRPWQPVSTTPSGELPELARHAISTDSADPLIAIEDEVYAALDQAGIPDGYIEVVVESPEMVIVRGSARSRDERTRILTAVMTVEDVREVLSDITVLPPGQQPAVLFDRQQREEARRAAREQ